MSTNMFLDKVTDEIDNAICIYDPMKKIKEDMQPVLKKHGIPAENVNLQYVKATWSGNKCLRVRFMLDSEFYPDDEEPGTFYVNKYIEY